MPATARTLPASLEFEIPCELGYVRRAGEKLQLFLAESGCCLSEAVDCRLALVEACNNAVQYVRPEAQHLCIGVRARCDAWQVEIRVIDHTGGLDWTAPASLPSTQAEGGRGVYLIKRVTDCSEYLREAGQNVLVLRKYRLRA